MRPLSNQYSIQLVVIYVKKHGRLSLIIIITLYYDIEQVRELHLKLLYSARYRTNVDLHESQSVCVLHKTSYRFTKYTDRYSQLNGCIPVYQNASEFGISLQFQLVTKLSLSWKCNSNIYPCLVASLVPKPSRVIYFTCAFALHRTCRQSIIMIHN